MVRAKFALTEVRESGYPAGTDGKTPYVHAGKTLVFQPHYDSSIEEDKRFAKATPSGRFEMLVDSPAALAYFQLGKYYYFDVVEA